MNLRQRLAAVASLVSQSPGVADQALDNLDEVWQQKRETAAAQPVGSTQRSRAINDAAAVRATQQQIIEITDQTLPSHLRGKGDPRNNKHLWGRGG